MTRAVSPTVRRRELAARLRELRQRSGMTIDEVAARLLVSATKISRLETAARPPGLRDVKDLCDLYGLSPAERDHLMTLARETRRPSWWQQYDVPENIGTYAELEAEAVSIHVYETSSVPALLQTDDYAQAVTAGTTFGISAEQVDQRVRSRLARQALLSAERPPELRAIVDEGALHRLIGGSATMRAQLVSLADSSRLPHVNVQIIPVEAGAHPGMNSSFTVLTLPVAAVSDVVYVEGLLGRFFLQTRADLDRYRLAYDRLRDAALRPQDSRDRILSIAGSLPE